MAKTKVTRLWMSTLDTIDTMKNAGVIPKQVQGDAASVDFILSEFLKDRMMAELEAERRQQAEKESAES